MNGQQLYRFADFTLDAEENVLRRDGSTVSLTPKMFDLLLVLVKNHGRILDKDFLLEAVWPDSFVEEGNITFNIRQLRIALGDDAQSPLYIETVPRRGYRFMAKVEEVAADDIDDIPIRGQNSYIADSGVRKRLLPLGVIALLLIVAIAIGAWFVRSKGNGTMPLLSASFASEKLSTTGAVFAAAISPDGKKVVYSVRTGSKQSVWLRELGTASNVQIIPPSDEDYYDLKFSPDENFIYFARAVRGIEKHIDIYRVSIIGGIPEKIVDKTDEQISISPDGNKISFFRCPRQPEEWCSLYIANAKDGKNERKLLSRPDPIRIGDVDISPDGKKIAFASGQSENAANEFSLTECDLETGIERPITEEKFFNIKNLAWLPDQSGLLLTASRVPNKYFRIWHVSATAGTAEPLTKDWEAYSILSLDKAANYLVSTQFEQDFRLSMFNLENPKEKRFLADGTRAAFASDGKIYYAAVATGNDEIWAINPDGSGQRQLTSDIAGDTRPIVSADSKTVYFASNRSGQAHVWRMNADGSDVRQVTKNEGGAPVFAATDGKTLYYRHAIKKTLWSVSLESGEEKEFIGQPKTVFAFSPDGAMIAFEEKKADDLVLTIIDASSQKQIRSFTLPRERPRLREVAWMPDGKSMLMLMADIDNLKHSIYQQPIDASVARKIIDLDEELAAETFELTISPDGKSFALVQGGWKHDLVLFKGLK